RRVLEERAQREIDLVGLADGGDDAGGEERVSAEREEIVVDPHPLAPQNLPPDRTHRLLDRRPRPLVPLDSSLRPRQPLPVHLPPSPSPSGHTATFTSNTTPAGTMSPGSSFPTASFSPPSLPSKPSPLTPYATSRFASPASSRATTTASFTPGCRDNTDSI